MIFKGDGKGYLYHSVRSENMGSILDDGFLRARTTHRYFPDGNTLKDDHPEYHNSKIMLGWSMTRNKFFAASWSEVMLVFDEDEIKKRLKVQPISWNYTIRGDNFKDHKKEAESYVIARKTDKTWEQLKADYEKLLDEAYDLSDSGDNSMLDALNEKGIDNFIGYVKSGLLASKTIPLSFCKKIYISDKVISELDEDGTLEKMKDLGLYGGKYNEDYVRKKLEREENSKRLILDRINNRRRGWPV